MLYKMYLEAVKWDGEDELCLLIFSNVKDGGKLNVEIPEPIGFDLRTLLEQREEGTYPYHGICELISQIGATVQKLIIGKHPKAGTGVMHLDVGGKTHVVDLFFADVIAIALVEDMPIYFDDSVCKKNELTLEKRLLFTRTASITGFSFDTDTHKYPSCGSE